MLNLIFQSLGFIGTIIFLSAYFPQIIHLLKVKDSTGVSISAMTIWFIGGLCLVIYSIYQRDIVFISLTILEDLALLVVVLLSIQYKIKK